MFAFVAGYVLVWLLLGAYVVVLGLKQVRLERAVRGLQRQLEQLGGSRWSEADRPSLSACPPDQPPGQASADDVDRAAA